MMLRIFRKTTVNGQQTFSTVPEPIEGNSSAFYCVFARVFFKSTRLQYYKTTRLQVLVRSLEWILISSIPKIRDCLRTFFALLESRRDVLISSIASALRTQSGRAGLEFFKGTFVR